MARKVMVVADANVAAFVYFKGYVFVSRHVRAHGDAANVRFGGYVLRMGGNIVIYAYIAGAGL